MLTEEIDEFLNKPLLHVAWHEEPIDTGDSYRERVKRWAVHSDGIDAGVVLTATYQPQIWRREFRLELKRKYAFARLDMRANQRSISISRAATSGPIYFPWILNRDLWLNEDGKLGRLTAHVAAPIGSVEFASALVWFLQEHSIAAHNIPAGLKLGR